MNVKLKHRDKALTGARPLRAGRQLEEEIKIKTILDALQHPATLLPLAVCISSTAWLLLISPMFGGAIVFILIASASGLWAAVSFWRQYRGKYGNNARELVESKEQERLQTEEAVRNQICENLRCGFEGAGSSSGAEALAELRDAYSQLQFSISQRRTTDPLSLTTIPGLLDEAYRRGLSVLSDALELMQLIHSIRPDDLDEEIARLKKDPDAQQCESTDSKRRRLIEDKRASSRERLETLSRSQLYIDQLIFQGRRCAAILRNTRVELALVRAGGSKTGVDSVVDALEATLRQVKELQDELERLDLGA